MAGSLFFWKPDPGPCPVDDTPHTGCTSDGAAVARGAVIVSVPPPQLFSTASYPRLLSDPPPGPLLATVRIVRMRRDVDALRAGVTYYMRPVQAEAVIARGDGEPVSPPTPRPPVTPPNPRRPARPPTAPTPPPPPPDDDDDDDDDDTPPRPKGRRR